MSTRPHDTFSRFAILACPSLVPLRHEVGSLELKVYLSLIFGYLGVFFSVEESHLSLTICPRHSCGCFMCGHFRRNTSSHCRVTPANTKLRSKMAKREKVSCGRVQAWAHVASASRSLELLPRKIALKLNFRRLKSYRAIVVLNTAPPPPRPEVRVTPLSGLYWGVPLDRIRLLVSVPEHGI